MQIIRDKKMDCTEEPTEYNSQKTDLQGKSDDPGVFPVFVAVNKIMYFSKLNIQLYI